jgi:hypothetical protein
MKRCQPWAAVNRGSKQQPSAIIWVRKWKLIRNMVQRFTAFEIIDSNIGKFAATLRLQKSLILGKIYVVFGHENFLFIRISWQIRLALVAKVCK